MAKRDGTPSGLGTSRGLGRGSKGVADWASCDAELLKRCVVLASNVGGALRFGYTADSGAYAIGIYGDGAPYTEYVTPHNDIDATLILIEQLFTDIADERATTPKTK